MKQYIISFICFSCLLLSGCNYLDTEPGDAISGDYFWETANAAALEQYCNLYYPKLLKDMETLCRECGCYDYGRIINLIIY